MITLHIFKTYQVDYTVAVRRRQKLIKLGVKSLKSLTIFRLGFLRVAQFGGGGGGGRKVPAAYNSKTINHNEMKFAGVVKDHKLINLV